MADNPGTPEQFDADALSNGFVNVPVDRLRYGRQQYDPAEVSGLFCDLLPDDARVLDVGCGTGDLSALLVEHRHARLVGLEPDGTRAAAARANGIDVHEAILSAEFIACHGPFDAVVFGDVLEHLPDPAATLRLAVTALGQGGCVLVSVPNVAHWSVRGNLLLGNFDYQPQGIMDATHLRWFTDRTAREMMVRCGLRVVASRKSIGAPLPFYANNRFWNRVPHRFKRPILVRLVRWFPGPFACQHVIKAVPV